MAVGGVSQLILGDCFEKELPSASFDMILTDPPYGTTKCKWDTPIDLIAWWALAERVLKPRGVVVMTAAQPFTSVLVSSNIKDFRYCWVWDKVISRGHLVVKKRPMARHEDVCVFYKKAPTYNPKMTEKNKPEKGNAMEASRTSICGGKTTGVQEKIIRTHSYPTTILVYKPDKRLGHPTQKPVGLMSYLIETYTNFGDNILDPFAGSGTVGVAARELGRECTLIEKDPEYFRIAKERLLQV